MSDEDKSEINSTIDSVTGLVKAIPIYDDLMQPAAKNLGKALGTVTQAVNVALAPLSILVWSYDQIRGCIETKITDKLKDTPTEDIIPPPPHIAVPAIEALRYTGEIEELKEMYANLIASSMNRRSVNDAHPAFVEIIKQLSADEALALKAFSNQNYYTLLTVRSELEDGSGGSYILKDFSLFAYHMKCSQPDKNRSYLDNFCRLGLVNVPEDYHFTDKGMYDELENHKSVLDARRKAENINGRIAKIDRKAIFVTDFGRQFIDICVDNKI